MSNQAEFTIRGLHYQTAEPVDVHIAEGRIRAVDSVDSAEARDVDRAKLPYIGPGLFELQLNGYNGLDFNTLPIPDGTTSELSRQLWREGVTSYLPTVITNSEDNILAAVHTIAKECDQDAATHAAVAGIHVEGPFISPEDGARGAHNKAYVQAPDWDMFQRWQEASGDRIRLLTLSPEWPNATDFIRKCAESGVIVSIGHTAATPEQIREAVAAGATMSTHFGNGSHTMLPRHPNYLWEQLASDELWACIIPDGFHIPDSVLKVVMRMKGERTILVSDAVMLSGMPAGEYDLHIGGKVVLTPEGRLHTAENPKILAGSAQMLLWGISHLVSRGLCSLSAAWEMASVRPAVKMGHPAGAGLQAGAPADLILLEWNEGKAECVSTYKNGVKVN